MGPDSTDDARLAAVQALLKGANPCMDAQWSQWAWPVYHTASVLSKYTSHGLALILLALTGGADLHLATRDGYTALHLAALALKPQLVQSLLEAGARVHVRTCSGKTAADCAMQFTDATDECRLASAECVPHAPQVHTTLADWGVSGL